MTLSDQTVYPNNGGQQATNFVLNQMGYHPEFDEQGRIIRSPEAKFIADIFSEDGLDYAGGELSNRQ